MAICFKGLEAELSGTQNIIEHRLEILAVIDSRQLCKQLITLTECLLPVLNGQHTLSYSSLFALKLSNNDRDAGHFLGINDQLGVVLGWK